MLYYLPFMSILLLSLKDALSTFFCALGFPPPKKKHTHTHTSLILAINVSSILHHFPEGLYDHCAQANHGIA